MKIEMTYEEKLAKANEKLKELRDRGERELKSEVWSYCQTIPERFQRGFLNAMLNNSKPAAIKAKCLDCVNYDQVQNEIGGCTVKTCPLYPYRPYQEKN